MYNFKKEKKSKNKVVILSGFSVEENNFSCLYANFKTRDIEIVDVLSYFGTIDREPGCWKKNIRNHLYELSLDCENLLVIGYSIGAVLAAHCCSLPFVKKTILLTPCYKYLQVFNDQENYFDSNIQKIIKSRNINPLVFSSVYNNLLVEFNCEIKNCVASLMLIQVIDKFDIEMMHIFKSIECLNSKNKTIVCFKKNTETILLDAQLWKMLPTLIHNYLELGDD